MVAQYCKKFKYVADVKMQIFKHINDGGAYKLYS